MTFNFEPQEKYLAWVSQGKGIFSQYGLCGKELHAQKKQRKTLSERLEKLKKFYPSLTSEEENRIIDFYENKGFGLSGICYQPKNHKGRCKNHPWKIKKFTKGSNEATIANGFRQKIIAGTENDGGDYGAMNRAGNRFWVIQAPRYIKAVVKKNIKELKAKTDQSIFVHQNLASGPYMAVLANFDMLAQSSQVQGFYDYIDVSPGMKEILKQRFNDLVKYFLERNIKISTDDGNPKCPLTHVVFNPTMFGQGSDEDAGVQFGHVEPKVYDEYMTKPYNVCLVTREGNSWQGNRSIEATFERMRRALAEQDK